MEQPNREYPLAYAPIPKGIIKEEPEDRDEFGESNELLLAYSPLPHVVIKEEPQLEDGGIQDETIIVIGYIKEEPAFEEEDGDECSLVAYAPLPHGDVKEESKVGDGHDGFSFGVQQTRQEGLKEAQVNEANDDASIVETPAPDNEIGSAGEPQAKKRKRTTKDQRSSEMMLSSNRLLRSRSKGSSTLENAGDGVKSTDEENLVPNHSLPGSAQRKKKSAKKLAGEASHSGQEKEKLPFKCKDCGRAFKVEKYLRKHLTRTCRIEPKFLCKQCGHQFKRKDDLRKHLMKTHNVEKSQLALFGAGPMIRPVFPFKCHKCEKTYTQKSNLTQHLKFGCDLGPSFPCTLCNYRATRKSSLREHLMAIHSVDRSQFTGLGAAAPETRTVQPFKCEKCGRSYKQKKGLKQHLKLHQQQHLINVHAGAGLPQLE